jgi:8-oxo-dGTP diphosphatase
MSNQNNVMVGLGVVIMKDGKILMGKRKGSHAEGTNCLPGGHFEYMESIIDSAKREVMEETGLEIDNVRFLCLSNLKEYAPKHYVDIGLLADWKSGEPQIMEPDKCDGWGWYDIDNLPSGPLFSTIPDYIKALKGENNFFDK